jgi:hypothetical protein
LGHDRRLKDWTRGAREVSATNSMRERDRDAAIARHSHEEKQHRANFLERLG